jgi:hypothetical protein
MRYFAYEALHESRIALTPILHFLQYKVSKILAASITFSFVQTRLTKENVILAV